MANLQGFLFQMGLEALLAADVVDVEDCEASHNQHNEERHDFEGHLPLFLGRQHAVHFFLARQQRRCSRRGACNRARHRGGLGSARRGLSGGGRDLIGGGNSTVEGGVVDMGDFDARLEGGVVDVLVVRHAVDVLGGGLDGHLGVGEVEVEVEVSKHLVVLHARVGVHLAKLGLVLQGRLQLLEQLLHRGLLLALPGCLTRLFLAHSLLQHARKVVLVDQRSEVADEFLFEPVCRAALALGGGEDSKGRRGDN